MAAHPAPTISATAEPAVEPSATFDASVFEHAYLHVPASSSDETVLGILPLLFDDPPGCDYQPLASDVTDDGTAAGSGAEGVRVAFCADQGTLAVVGTPETSWAALLEEATAPRPELPAHQLRIVSVDTAGPNLAAAELDPDTGLSIYAALFVPTQNSDEHGRFYPCDTNAFSQANRLDDLVRLVVDYATGTDRSWFTDGRSRADQLYYLRTARALRLLAGDGETWTATRAGRRLASAPQDARFRLMRARALRSHAFCTYLDAPTQRRLQRVERLLRQAETTTGRTVRLSSSTMERRLVAAARWDALCQQWATPDAAEPQPVSGVVVDLAGPWDDLDEAARQPLVTAWQEAAQKITPETFEHLACEVWTRHQDLVDAFVTRASGDRGIDFEGIRDRSGQRRRVVGQAKHREAGRAGASVGSDRVRCLRGSLRVHHLDLGVLITNGTFSKDAREEAADPDNYPIELVDGDRLARLAIDQRLGVDHVGGGRYVVQPLEDVIARLRSVDIERPHPVAAAA